MKRFWLKSWRACRARCPCLGRSAGPRGAGDIWCDAHSSLSWHSAAESAADSLHHHRKQVTLSTAESGGGSHQSSNCLDVVLHADTHWGRQDGLEVPNIECTCLWRSLHVEWFSPEIPINKPPDVVAGSYAEALIHARSICGKWTTSLERSDSLDPQMRHIGLGKLKRAVMNRLAVPFGAQLEDDDTVLHSWIVTPLGPKSMHASLVGKEMTDIDADVGKWYGIAKMVDFSTPRFCNGKPVRALQLLRRNERFGEAYETRVVLPDEAEGKIMLFNITLYPLEVEKPPIVVDRILIPDRP